MLPRPAADGANLMAVTQERGNEKKVKVGWALPTFAI